MNRAYIKTIVPETSTEKHTVATFSTDEEKGNANNMNIEMEPLLSIDPNKQAFSSAQEHVNKEEGGLSSVLSNLSDAKSSPSIFDLFETNPYLYALKVILLCSAFMVIGPSLILLNKYILRDLEFNYPMFLSSLGLVSSALFAYAFVKLNISKLEHSDKIDQRFWLRNILPVAVCSAATLALGNAAYLYLTVSFIQMLKAFSPVLVLFIAVSFRVDEPTMQVIASVLVICFGTFLASIGEVNFNMFGLILFMLASVAEGVKLVITQKVLTEFKCGIIEGQYVFAPAGATSLMILSFFFEFRKMFENDALSIICANPGIFLLASTMGLAVNLLTFVVIQATSSVTIKVLSTARNALLVLYQVYFHGEIITALQCLGYVTSLGGFGAYNYFRAKK